MLLKKSIKENNNEESINLSKSISEFGGIKNDKVIYKFENIIHLPMKNSVLYFVIILIGIMVHTVYCVFNDGYFGMNNPPKQYYIFMFFIGLLNLVIGFINSKGGRLIDDGIIDTPFINLLCGMMFVVLGICIVIKRIISKSDDESDDEEDDEQ